MAEKTYQPGDVVIAEGTEADFVGYVLEGSADVFKTTGSEEVLIGRIAAGEYVGEMAALENTLHGATVRAREKLTLEVSPPDAFLNRISENGAVARKLMVRLSHRLRRLNQAYSDLATGAGAAAAIDPAPQLPAVIPEKPSGTGIRLMPDSPEMERVFAGHGKIDMVLPFVVGRALGPSDPPTSEIVSLQLEDRAPYRLSRVHFSVVRDGGRYWVVDQGSYLGTVVNGRAIGREFGADAAPLEQGENTVSAGGVKSPFCFRIAVDR
jgi:hypothetical protein